MIFNELARTYLECNAAGMWDGGLKARTHRNLCVLFVSERYDISLREATDISLGDELLSGLVRKATLSLTDNLDEAIGFPLDKAPNYRKLVPLFVDEFNRLANEWADERTDLFSDTELVTILERVTKKRFVRTIYALESYGFEFVAGEPTGPEQFLTMRSKLGQVVTLRPNAFFGCNFRIGEHE